jgi:hypothetical protein
MSKSYILVLVLILIIIYLLFFYKNTKESFVVVSNRGEIMNPFNDPDESGFVQPETSPPPKPKCCPNKTQVEPKVVEVCKKPESQQSCKTPEPICKKEQICPPCPKVTNNCPPCPELVCPPCKPCEPVCPSKIPDLSKYVLKSSIPPCPTLPDMNQYILKSEIPACPRLPDMSKYVLKSSVPPPIQCPTCPPCPPPPEVNVCDKLLKSKEKDCGVCPPCPRVKCPKPKLECKQVNNGSGKYYTDKEIEALVKKKVNSYKTERPGNNSSCIPKPYDSNDFQSPLLNNDLTGSKI